MSKRKYDVLTSSIPLRLVGGAGDPLDFDLGLAHPLSPLAPGGGDADMDGGGDGGAPFAAAPVPRRPQRWRGGRGRRNRVHARWSAQATHLPAGHWNRPAGGPALAMQNHLGVAYQQNPLFNGAQHRITRWHFEDNPFQYAYTPALPGGISNLFQNGHYCEALEQNVNDLYSVSRGPLPISALRAAEIQMLQEAGDINILGVPGGVLPALGAGEEALWRFMGMTDSPSHGPAWSCFWYALSDLYTATRGFHRMSDIMLTLMNICMDIALLTHPTIQPDVYDINNNLVTIDFEGIQPNGPGGARNYVTCNGPLADFHLNAIVHNPDPVLERILWMCDSDFTFLFHRVFVHVVTNFTGNSLRDMPLWMRELREGKKYKGVKGYQLIPDNQDNSCGLDAVIWGLSNVLLRIQKMCKQSQKQVPALCLKFANFRKRIYAKKGGLQAKKLQAELREELATLIQWKPGHGLSHEQICQMVSLYAAKHDLDIGVVIFDAVKPLAIYSASYEHHKQVPSQRICLVHWNYYEGDAESEGEEILRPVKRQTGHYDCINAVNVTKWLTNMNPKAYTKNIHFDFHSLALLPTGSSGDKGLFCKWCRHYQKYMTVSEWEKLHGGSQQSNLVYCETCEVSFRSEECYRNHLNKHHGLATTACEDYFQCKECKRVHKRSWDCSLFFCRICMAKFPIKEQRDHICYIRASSDKKMARLPLVFYSDMEGTRINGHHEPVCISTCWSTICEEHRQARDRKTKTRSPCKVCKSHQVNWEWFCDDCLDDPEVDASNECPHCLEKHICYFMGSDCLEKYLDWIMENYLGSTVIFHNGGKYDLHMLVPVILQSGKYYIVNDATRSSQIIFMSVGVRDGTWVEGDDIKKKYGKPSTRSSQRVVTFKDSLTFIQSSLRNFPDMFHLEQTDKGRFPYELLNEKGWEDWDGECPGYEYFGVSEKEMQNLPTLAINRRKEIEEILAYISEEKKSGKKWNAMEKLKQYTIQDTVVLHDGCERFRKEFWNLLKHDPFQYVTLPAAVAGTYRRAENMPEKSMQIFRIMDREWQHQGLRGGRCEAFKMYWKRTKPSQHFRWVDVNSEYPAVQAYGYFPIGAMTLELKYQNFIGFNVVSASFYSKTGIFLEDVLRDPTGQSGCGLIECEFRYASDVFIPVIPARVRPTDLDGKEKGKYMKNVFQNKSGSCVLFLTVLAMAVKYNQVIVTGIKRLQYWKNTSNMLFRKFMCHLYASKVEASGWPKILNKPMEAITEEEKKEFIRQSILRDVNVDPSKVEDNPGKRTVSKLANNSGWGFFSKKLATNVNHFFDNYVTEEVDDMVDLIDSLHQGEGKRMIGTPVGVGRYTKIRSTKEPELVTDDEMDKRVAYHVGGQVPAYGLQKLTEGLLSLDPSQPAYCDTDSIGYVYDEENKSHTEIATGPYLGDWVDEYPKYEIDEFVTTGCKSYFIKLVNKKDPKDIIYKGKFKGIGFNSSAFSLTDEKQELSKLGMEEMKGILFAALEKIRVENTEREEQGYQPESIVDELTFTFHFTNFFKRGADYKIRAVPEHKTVRFTYDKRTILLPTDMEKDWTSRLTEVNTVPIADSGEELTTKEVEKWWKARKTERQTQFFVL